MVGDLLKYARPVEFMTEREKMCAKLWSGLKELPHFAAQISRRPVEGDSARFLDP